MARASIGLARTLRNAIGSRLMSGGPYSWLLNRQAPTGLVFATKDPWPGNPEIATDLFHGIYEFAGESHQVESAPPWPLIEEEAGGAWAEEVLSFSWLRHFAAAGGPAAGRQARALIDTWIDEFGVWHPLAWRPDILAQRAISWLSHSTFFLEDAEPEFRSRWLASTSRQFRHLARTSRKADPGTRRMRALSGVVVAGLCLPGGRAHVGSAIKKLLRDIEAQVLADGGHISRSPTALVSLIQDFSAVRSALTMANRDTPYILQNALNRMGPMLALFRHGDGRLALFNGGYEDYSDQIEIALGLADAQESALANAGHSGFQRLDTGDAMVIADAGAPPPVPFSGAAHAGTASFEMSVGAQRVIVNCGPGGSEELSTAGRATAAHSTLVVDDSSSCRFRRRGRKRGQIYQGPREVSVTREESDGNIWLDLEHDGYGHKFGVLHRRRLYLEDGGGDLRGEDVLTKLDTPKRKQPSHSGNLPLSIRFHLHPDVRASLSQDGASIVLRLPDGDGWKFRASGGTLSLVESIYFGVRGQVRRSEQIMITGTIEFGEASVKWALRRIRGGG